MGIDERKRVLVLALVAMAPFTREAMAADTLETFGPGATDYELYLGFDGAGRGDYEKVLWGETLLGFGLIERLSAFATISAEANERLYAGTGGASIGLFGTPFDSEHFDLDLLFQIGLVSGEIAVAPALELNLDARPDLALCGLYLRAEEDLTGRDDSIADDPETEDVDEARTRYAFVPTTALTAGAYFTIAEIHQLLLEFDVAFRHRTSGAPEGDPSVFELGGVALGYNVAITEAVELLAQVSVDVPDHGEGVAAGFMVGLIATMPSPAD